jgi:hypothetical protein
LDDKLFGFHLAAGIVQGAGESADAISIWVSDAGVAHLFPQIAQGLRIFFRNWKQ